MPDLLPPDAGAQPLADEPDPAFGETDDDSAETPLDDEPLLETYLETGGQLGPSE